jgi:hypothetical protein
VGYTRTYADDEGESRFEDVVVQGHSRHVVDGFPSLLGAHDRLGVGNAADDCADDDCADDDCTAAFSRTGRLRFR